MGLMVKIEKDLTVSNLKIIDSTLNIDHKWRMPQARQYSRRDFHFFQSGIIFS